MAYVPVCRSDVPMSHGRRVRYRLGLALNCYVFFWDKGQPSAEAAQAVYSSINKRNVLLEN